jgi:hypothetical protein
MIYFFSDPYIYSFENLYPLYLKFKEMNIDCFFDAEFSHQGSNISKEAKSHRGKLNLSKIRKGELPQPKLVILNQCWGLTGAIICKEFSSKGIPVITTEHGSPMFYYGEGRYRGNLKGSISHPTWGKVGSELMVKFGCKPETVPALGSPRIDHYFSSREIKSKKNNDAVIFGTKKEGMKPFSKSIEEKIDIICEKHDNVKFKGKVLGPMKMKKLESIDKDFSSYDFYNLFNDIGHAYFWFPSSLITIAKVMRCKTYALYSDSKCKFTSKYFNDHKDHIISYNSSEPINTKSNSIFLDNNLTNNGTENIFNYILNEKSFNINN